jgi:lysozyme
MKVSPQGLDLIKGFEGLRLHAYKDAVGIPTIGYGHTKKVRMDQISTKEEAESFLREDLHDIELAIQREVYFGLAPHQFDALASLIFNIGIGAFIRSTLLKKLNASDILGAADEFLRWNKGTKEGVKYIIEPLAKRRAKERQIFLQGY